MKPILDKKMLAAINQARLGASLGEVPVGAAVYRGDTLISSAHNETEAGKSPLLHAELLALSRALEKLGRAEMRECALYVTLEPCPMCAGAIIAAHPRALYYGAYNREYGAHDGFVNLFSHPRARGIEVYGGICEAECAELLRDFFSGLRSQPE